jgi:hypothetical protein
MNADMSRATTYLVKDCKLSRRIVRKPGGMHNLTHFSRLSWDTGSRRTASEAPLRSIDRSQRVVLETRKEQFWHVAVKFVAVSPAGRTNSEYNFNGPCPTSLQDRSFLREILQQRWICRQTNIGSLNEQLQIKMDGNNGVSVRCILQ